MLKKIVKISMKSYENFSKFSTVVLKFKLKKALNSENTQNQLLYYCIAQTRSKIQLTTLPQFQQIR